MRSTILLFTLIDLGLEILPYLITESMQGHGIAFDDEHLPATHNLDDNIQRRETSKRFTSDSIVVR
jgi:hypothetical protein